jgi:hypothetical protein
LGIEKYFLVLRDDWNIKGSRTAGTSEQVKAPLREGMLTTAGSPETLEAPVADGTSKGQNQ